MSWFNKAKELAKATIKKVEELDSKYEMICLGVEVRLTGGTSFDEAMEEVVVPAVKKGIVVATAATKETVTNINRSQVLKDILAETKKRADAVRSRIEKGKNNE